jgi:hypothetical protein
MMRPAFTSTKAAAAFAGLLLLVLLAPVLAGKKFLPPREQAYATLSWGYSAYPWIRHEIFEETNDIDVVFMGASRMFFGVDVPYVQAELSKKLGRPAVVRAVAWTGAGYDALYLLAQDLLAHRRVRLLVFDDENRTSAFRNPAIPAWFRWGEDAAALSGLSLAEQARFYFAAVLGMPRNLLGQVRSDLPAALVSARPNILEQFHHTDSIAGHLGTASARLGFADAPLQWGDAASFAPYVPQTSATPADAEVYSSTGKTDYAFARAPLPDCQVHFARQFSAVARVHGCRLVLLHHPILEEGRSPLIQERSYWPDIFQTEVTMLGIPPAKLFGGLNDAAMKSLFIEPVHLNQNGQKYFTLLITPRLLQLYEASIHP